jgi:ABC-type multidrug transport system fused ATPase/permease subunit
LVAGKFAFEVIDRDPVINDNDQSAKVIELKGEIEFKDVVFYYPSRPDQKVLRGLSTKFELGKTTAIVGPSGAGKSSIALMIERFYDPNEGMVLVDGLPLKSINLQNYRRQIGYVS